MESETKSQIDLGVQEVFRQIFDNKNLVVARSTTSAEVEGWDSLANIQMIVALEKRFGVKFTTAELVEIQNVGDIIDLIKRHASSSKE